ncbi:histidine kinase [Ruegeria marisrubri]|uniref:Histidine kinase n=1 Tax=Ruegeria marisrubri TaxID=1685379 RepID=A0A0X3TQN8_9RHOB|nr:Hpt domain-containing protein [Ruegeria marisrubri]KUJ78065.1 histidine kinase [Ruegeria marisrubri]
MIHWPRVQQLRDEVGADEFDEVVRIFLEEVEEVIGRIKADTGRTGLEQNLHFLKGGAASLGFQSFADLCQDGELRAAAGSAQAVDLDAIFEAFRQSRLLFQTGLQQNS